MVTSPAREFAAEFYAIPWLELRATNNNLLGLISEMNTTCYDHNNSG